MSLVPESKRDSRGARRALGLLFAIHAVLLLLMLRDYFADNDLGYHISLARQYAEHGTYWWDSLNWAPTGRPNLQGPALHVAIAGLGRLLGGAGWDFVLAFSLLAVVQWSAAVFTAVFFARRFGGDRAALFAGALFMGNIFSAAPFFVGVPSGWIFILSAWAIHFFLEERYIWSALFGALTTYVHLGGAPVIGLGILLAAILTRRWRGLVITGCLTLVLASPYIVHVLVHLGWYNGQRGHVAGSVALFTYALAAPGLIWLLWRRERGLFLLLWAIAPLAWLFQDGLRFFLQSTVAASAIAGVFVAWWAAGQGFPRELDWREAEALARAVDESGLQDRIFFPYYDSMCGGMSVFVPVRQRGGHWGEVRPAVDPADAISTGAFVHMLPLPPDDSLLVEVERRGLATSHGGGRETVLVTLPVPGDREEVNPLVADVIASESGWLIEHAVPNLFPPATQVFNVAAIRDRRELMAVQKAHVGRIQLAVLLYAFSLEETAMDYVDEVRFERFLTNLGSFANEAQVLRTQALPSAGVDRATDRLFDEFF
jgi:hypothetical protein